MYMYSVTDSMTQNIQHQQEEASKKNGPTPGPINCLLCRPGHRAQVENKGFRERTGIVRRRNLAIPCPSVSNCVPRELIVSEVQVPHRGTNDNSSDLQLSSSSYSSLDSPSWSRTWIS